MALLGTTATLLAQAPDPSASAYRAVVDDYRLYGASAVRVASEYTNDAVTAAVDSAIGGTASGQAWTWEELRAAAMLHTEVMVVQLRGRQPEAAQVSLGAALRLLDTVTRRTPAQAEFSYRWHTTVAALLRTLNASAFAANVTMRIKDRFASEARTRYESGLLLELRGCLDATAMTAQNFGQIGDTAALPSRWWGPAAEAYQAALASDPSLLQAALHLGRIRMLEGRLDESSALFEQAARSVDPRVTYLAHLFAGSIAERRDRLADAQQQYRHAIAGYPWGQAGPIALAQVLSRTGREEEARALLLERLNGRQLIAEPLWTYVIARPGDELAALFDELRVEVSR